MTGGDELVHHRRAEIGGATGHERVRRSRRATPPLQDPIVGTSAVQLEVVATTSVAAART